MYQSPTAISFQVEVNDASKNLATTNIREKVCQVSVPAEFIIPWLSNSNLWDHPLFKIIMT